MRRLAVTALLAGGVAHADTPLADPTAIEVDRADAPGGRVELGFDGGAPVDAWRVALTGGWLERPITYDGVHPVRRRQTLMLGGAVALGSIVVDARLPLAHQVGDRVPGGGALRARYVLGDLRLGARVHVARGAAGAVFVRGDVALPTGDDGDLAGDASWSLAWRLIGRAALPAGVVVAGSAGIRLRGREVLVGDRLVGDELLGNVGVLVPLPPVRPLWCAADQVKLTAELHAVLGDDVGIGTGPSPVEARAGVVTRPTPQLTVGVRAGAGLNDQIGAPRYRLLLELAYQPSARAQDPVRIERPGDRVDERVVGGLAGGRR